MIPPAESCPSSGACQVGLDEGRHAQAKPSCVATAAIIASTPIPRWRITRRVHRRCPPHEGRRMERVRGRADLEGADGGACGQVLRFNRAPFLSVPLRAEQCGVRAVRGRRNPLRAPPASASAIGTTGDGHEAQQIDVSLVGGRVLFVAFAPSSPKRCGCGDPASCTCGAEIRSCVSTPAAGRSWMLGSRVCDREA